MFSHLVKCPYFLASKQEVSFIHIFSLKYLNSQENHLALVLEFLRFETYVYSAPTEDADVCQEKQHGSCIFASVIQALKYYFKIATYGEL